MKKIKLLLFIVFLLAVKNINAAETEPNNTKAQANTLALNGNNSGAIGNATDVDWWKVTTNADGKLNVTITISNSLNLWCQIYDNNGTTLLEQGYTAGTKAVSADGLAAGIYYLKLYPYYAGQLPNYTISNTLTVPAQANDVEPNGTKAQAVVLPLNGSKTGHINYYYNNTKDTLDWYKVTTNADGRIRLTVSSANGQNVWAYLYDNNGTTELASGYTSGTSAVVNKDGLAQGTYYIKIKTYYTSEWAPYTLSDSLFKPAQANDAEPNNTKAQAIVLPLNGSKKGHTNYYYNMVKDTSDWYSLTTDADGMLTINIQSHNGQNVWAYLYDNNGTTLLASAYSSTATSYKYDGLKPGTYYIRVKTYYANEWAPYTLSNTLSTYANANDAEPNDYFKQAKTIGANTTKTGHVNFYYNGVADAVDHHKINYTGTGNLKLVFNQENRLKYGSTAPTWFRVYKDTSASPISSGYYYETSGDINLTGLTQGDYYIKVYTYYNGEGNHFSSYSITNTFTQNNIATIVVSAYDANASCSSTNSITYKLNKSSNPYKVQLYRFNLPYRSPVTSNSKTVTFDNLPTGLYYATVYGDGATGAAFGKSKTVAIEPVPAGLNTTQIKGTQARLNWNSVTCADYFTIEYKVQGTATWTKKKTTGNVKTFILRSLTPNTKYNWRVATTDSANGLTATGKFADSISFTTAASLLAATGDIEDNLSISKVKNTDGITVAPNPAITYFTIRYNGSVQDKITATLFDANGKAVWSSGSVTAAALNGKQVNVNQFRSGLYYLKIADAKGSLIESIKVSIAK